jgi:hypothetical protein
MGRPTYRGEAEALADLGPHRTRPAWLQRRHALPFQDLSDDEFEVLELISASGAYASRTGLRLPPAQPAANTCRYSTHR